MATLSNEPEQLIELDREISDALSDCDDLLERARELLRRTGQDNDLARTKEFTSRGVPGDRCTSANQHGR
jgi:hypothetical protein